MCLNAFDLINIISSIYQMGYLHLPTTERFFNSLILDDRTTCFMERPVIVNEINNVIIDGAVRLSSCLFISKRLNASKYSSAHPNTKVAMNVVLKLSNSSWYSGGRTTGVPTVSLYFFCNDVNSNMINTNADTFIALDTNIDNNAMVVIIVFGPSTDMFSNLLDISLPANIVNAV